MAVREKAPSQQAAPRGLAPADDRSTADRVAEIQRSRIIAAMAEVCAEHGGAGVTVAHIVACSGVSRRTFYEQFADRQECFLAALEEAIACLAYYLEPVQGCGTWRERIRASLVALLEFLDDEPLLGRLVMVDTLGAGPIALRRRQELTCYVVAALDEGRAEAEAGEGPPPLTAEGLVGGVLSVLHARLIDADRAPVSELSSSLMGMIVLPYLGAAASRQELRRPVPTAKGKTRHPSANPLGDLRMRLTYRTVCVLSSIARRPGLSNREVGLAAGIQDQGQISKLLTRLTKLGLIENNGSGQLRGAPNEWTLTRKGIEVEQVVRAPASV